MKRLLLCVLFLALAASGCDWSQVYANAGHTNANPVEPKFTEAAGSQFEMDWQVACTCLQVVESGGLVYATDSNDGIHAFDVTDGSIRWEFGLPEIQHVDFVAVGNGLAYLTMNTLDGHFVVLAVDAQTGALRWARTIDFGSYFNPTVLDGDSLIVVSGTGETSDERFKEISSLDIHGNVEWSAATPGTVVDLVADAGRNIYVSSEVRAGSPLQTVASYITRFDSSTGAPSPVIQSTIRYSHLRVANGLLYFNHDSPTPTVPRASTAVSAVRLDTSAPAWSAPGEGLSAVSGEVAITSGSAGMTARDPSTGAVIWQQSNAGGEVFISGQLLFVNGGIDIRSVADGRLLGTTDVWSAGTNNVVALGRIFTTGATELQSWSPSAP
jgi:outer membrane protein assembly factor BamB